MSRRIEIELTSSRPDGTWTWRAAGAREPRGVLEAAVLPGGATVSQVLTAEVETDLDGSRVLSIVPPKQKAARTGLLEILPSEKPFEPVTQKLARRARDGRGDSRKGGRRHDGAPGESRRGPGREKKEGDRPRRPFFEAPPEIPQRPKPKRVKPRRENLDTVLAQLPEAHRAIAEKVVGGGIPAVRSAIEEQNTRAVAEGREKITADALVAEAERLLPSLRRAEWIDKAVAAERILDDVDVRDLRSIVNVGESLSGHDDRTRALLATMKTGLAARQATETKLWQEDIRALAEVGRIVRALRLSSQPPKAGVPFPADLAALMAEKAVAALTPDAPADRWITLLEHAAFSPVHARILPVAAPVAVTEDLLKTVTRLGPLMPQVATLFGVEVPPGAKMPRMLPPSRPDRKAKETNRRGPGNTASSTRREQKPRVAMPVGEQSTPEEVHEPTAAESPTAPPVAADTSEPIEAPDRTADVDPPVAPEAIEVVEPMETPEETEVVGPVGRPATDEPA